MRRSSTGKATCSNEHIAEFFSTQKQLDVCLEGQRRGLPVTPLLTPGQVIDNEHTRARGTFQELPVAPDFPVLLPSGFLQLDATRVGPVSGPPALGADNRTIYCDELGLAPERFDTLRAEGTI